MDELEQRLRLQFFTAEPKRLLPGWIEPFEVAAEMDDAEHVDRKGEKTILQVRGFRQIGLPVLRPQHSSASVDPHPVKSEV